MTKLRLIPLSLLLLLVLGACGEKEETIEMAASPAAASLLAYVPADTPYLAANLQPVPNAVIDAHFERAQPVLEELQNQASRVKTQLAASNEPTGEPLERLMLAAINAFDG